MCIHELRITYIYVLCLMSYVYMSYSTFSNKILIMKIRRACTDIFDTAVKHISLAKIKELLNILLTFTETHFQV